VVTLLLLAAGLFWLRPLTVLTPTGELVVAHLPDGSEVELNSGSRLTYRRPFGWRTRRVRLSGEAFFDVAHDAAPFVVETFNSTVTVLGTRFNVRAWPEGDAAATTVVLERGRVRLAAGPDAGQAVVLGPGQMSGVAAGSTAPAPPVSVSVDEALVWRQRGLHFTDAPVGAILDELERRTGTRITVTKPALRELRATLLLEQMDDAEAVLAILAEMHGLRYRSVEGGYELAPSRQP
jgi:ferric-dicitrate binding protein FerR (iron transport regulator)